MKVCVLQPDYSTTTVDYQYYDPPRNLSPLLPEDTVDHVFLNKLTTYKQLKSLSKMGYDIFVNLCEGYLEWEVPSIDVIHTLELLNLPYTGPTPLLYDPTKEMMKYVAYSVGVQAPRYIVVESVNGVEKATAHLQFPLFIKPAKAGDSLGIDEHSRVLDFPSLERKVAAVLQEYPEILVEEYIEGREFTVLVVADNQSELGCNAFTPVEYIFPEGNSYKTYALKTSELHPDANLPVRDEVLALQLQEAARRIFNAFGGVGYARMDFRMNQAGELFFLEINFTCSVFYSEGYEGSADHILRFDGIGQQGFLHAIIAEGIARHQRKQKRYVVKGNSINGYGIYAKDDITVGAVIFRGEEQSQRIVTRRHVQEHWSTSEQLTFRRYAYPLSSEVFLLWDENPMEWAPQNHSCNPNTVYSGLNVVALRTIAKDEELTLDYADFLNEDMEPFQCHCGADNCRGWIQGKTHNSVTSREQQETIQTT